MANQQEPPRTGWLHYGVFPLALWASLLNLLNFNGYPLFRPEVAIIVFALGVTGLLMGLVQDLARPRLWAPVTGLFAAFVIDLNAPIGPGSFVACWAASSTLAFLAKELFPKMLFAAATAVVLFQGGELVLGSGGPVAWPDEAENRQDPRRPPSVRPAIVHVVLDSHLGLGGMALGPDIYRNMRIAQAAFFTSRGFQIYPQAYSRHARTLNSLPALFSYERVPPPIAATGPAYAIPDPLPYFIDLDQRGYRIDALLPAYLDLCARQKFSRCRTFQSSELSSMDDTDLSAFDRAKVLAFTIANLSPIATFLAASIRPDPEARIATNRGKLFPLTSLTELERFTASLSQLRRGEVRFAHLLLPHDPYMLAPDCSLKPESSWLDEHGPGRSSARERAYADQLACLRQRLARMLDALDSTPAGREAIVVIHGDHGSRIAPSQPMVGGPRLSRRELLMSHSTLFAIRVPGEAAGEVPGTFALDALLADFRARDFASAPRPRAEPASIALTDETGAVREWQPLPPFGSWP